MPSLLALFEKSINPVVYPTKMFQPLTRVELVLCPILQANDFATETYGVLVNSYDWCFKVYVFTLLYLLPSLC